MGERETYEARIRELEARLAHADKLSCIGQMSASIAHEINNPVAYVLANLTALSDLLNELEAGIATEAERQALTGAREILVDCSFGMERIRRIAKDLKVFARVEEEAPQRIDVNRVVEMACQLADNELRHRARLTSTLGNVPPIIADQGKLTQVVLNLLINAAQALESGDAKSHRIGVITRVEGSSVVISVSDTGSGIRPEVLPRIFDPFFTTKPKDGGTGLGLWLVREIVRQHNGDIRVESKLGHGATFEVRLPVTRAGSRTLSTPPEPAANQNASIPARRRARVLLIDDDAALRRALKRMLGIHHEVVEGDGGAGAIEILDSGQCFDAVLCDLMMPDVDGPAVYEHIARTRPELLDRLAFLSGGVFTQRVRAFLDGVEHQVVEKPVSREALLRVIDGLLESEERPIQLVGASK